MAIGDETSDVGQPLVVTYREEGAWGVLGAAGELDVVTSGNLGSGLKSATPGLGIIVDMYDVTFVDTTGLGVLIGLQRRVEESGGGFRLVVPSPHIRRVFDITGLDEVFSVYDSLAAARE